LCIRAFCQIHATCEFLFAIRCPLSAVFIIIADFWAKCKQKSARLRTIDAVFGVEIGEWRGSALLSPQARLGVIQIIFSPATLLPVLGLKSGDWGFDCRLGIDGD
jgi:hypothetical protein